VNTQPSGENSLDKEVWLRDIQNNIYFNPTVIVEIINNLDFSYRL
jgi:hypothetical protein